MAFAFPQGWEGTAREAFTTAFERLLNQQDCTRAIAGEAIILAARDEKQG
jgi:hypothetical protein